MVVPEYNQVEYPYHPINLASQVNNESEGMGFAFLIPLIIAAVGAGISTGGSIVAGRMRTNSQLKVMATTATDEVERNLAANRDWFKGLTNPTVAEKQAAVDFFHNQWSTWVNQMTTLGEPGNRAVRERQRGGVNSWGADWWQLYLDPIMEIKTVEEQQATTTTTTGGSPTVSIENVMGIDSKTLALILLAGGAAWYAMGGKK